VGRGGYSNSAVAEGLECLVGVDDIATERLGDNSNSAGAVGLECRVGVDDIATERLGDNSNSAGAVGLECCVGVDDIATERLGDNSNSAGSVGLECRVGADDIAAERLGDNSNSAGMMPPPVTPHRRSAVPRAPLSCKRDPAKNWICGNINCVSHRPGVSGKLFWSHKSIENHIKKQKLKGVTHCIVEAVEVDACGNPV
jgi:hypothetical protein